MNSTPSSVRVGSPQRRRFSASQIQRFLADFDRSGLSGVAFARQRGLCYTVFCRWRKLHRAPALRPPRLRAVPLGSLLAPAWMAEIALPNGATLRLGAQASAAWTDAVLRRLARSC